MFEDARWNGRWRTPVRLPEARVHPSGYRIVGGWRRTAEVFGHRCRLAEPYAYRALVGPDGWLWMSNTPQEMMMTLNAAERSRGRVLVGGLGLALYPQMVPTGCRVTVVELSAAVVELVAGVLPRGVEVEVGDVAEWLRGPVRERYDTVFLDVWPTIDAAHLPEAERLRAMAERHLAPGGEILIWGYGWMRRLLDDARRHLTAVPVAERAAWLADQSTAARELLGAEVAPSPTARA